MFLMENNQDSMVDTLKNINYVTITDNGEKKTIEKNDKDFKKVIGGLEKIYNKGFLMPAFGVSLHDETIKAMEEGVWLELSYLSEQVKNGLPFTSLLIKIEDGYGFNIIRKYGGRFEGRCLYLSLDRETHLEDILP